MSKIDNQNLSPDDRQRSGHVERTSEVVTPYINREARWEQLENWHQYLARGHGYNPDVPLVPSELKAITELANGFGIPLREFLSRVGCHNGRIKIFDAASLDIPHINQVAALTEIVELNINQNAIEDISCLRNLTKLRTLKCTFNEISDLSPLAGRTFRDLSIGYSPIKELESLLDCSINILSIHGTVRSIWKPVLEELEKRGTRIRYSR